MRFVTKFIHAYLDYPVAIALLVLPFLLGIGGSHPLALIAAPIAGAAALALTIFTDHHLGLVRLLPYRLHLAVDLALGVVFLLLPLTFGFAGLDAAFYWLTGAAVVAVIALSKTETDERAAA